MKMVALPPTCARLGLAFACLLAVACRHEPAIGTDVAVRIGGEEMRYERFETYLRDNVDVRDQAISAAVLSQLFDQFLDEELLIRLAIERGLVSSDDSQPAPDHRTAARFLLAKVAPPNWGDEDLAAFYAAHQDDFRRPEGVRLQQILVHEETQAREAAAALAAGQEFRQVAARWSQVPSTELSGSNGRFTREDLPAAFADAILALEVGEVSEILPADYGYHIFRVAERYPDEVLPLERVREKILQALRRQWVDELVASYVQEARERYPVEIYLSNLPFDYRGFYAPSNES